REVSQRRAQHRNRWPPPVPLLLPVLLHFRPAHYSHLHGKLQSDRPRPSPYQGKHRLSSYLSAPDFFPDLLPLFLNISLCRDFTMNYIRMYIDAF
uniref:Uncharacterized protein n=1 Tax=Aegilops tauschii subsp. strangulata TaxID=200361 RepID=A0A453N972_AEGTS